jgi:hypothetical protein
LGFALAVRGISSMEHDHIGLFRGDGEALFLDEGFVFVGEKLGRGERKYE